MITVAFLDMNNVIHPLTWVVFEQKYVKFTTFFYFPWIGTIGFRL